MTEKEISRLQDIYLPTCPRCSKSHSFKFEIIFGKGAVAFGAYDMLNTEYYDYILKCPETEKNIVISVPVEIRALESLILIREKR